MNFRYKLMRFLSGRYGVDSLFFAMFIIASVLSVVNCFVRSYILQYVVYVIVLLAFLRAMSRNIEARSRENHLFKVLEDKIRKRINTYHTRKADIAHVYKKCPRCHAVLRLPRRKGIHETVCPQCSKRFKVWVKKG